LEKPKESVIGTTHWSMELMSTNDPYYWRNPRNPRDMQEVKGTKHPKWYGVCATCGSGFFVGEGLKDRVWFRVNTGLNPAPVFCSSECADAKINADWTSTH